MRKCLDTFKDKPIFIKDETDLFNQNNTVIVINFYGQKIKANINQIE